MRFEDKYEPIEVVLKDIEGNECTYHTSLITGEKLEKIQIISTGKEYKNEPAKQIYDMMEIIFSIPGESFKKYSMPLLKKVIDYVCGEIKKKSIEDNG